MTNLLLGLNIVLFVAVALAFVAVAALARQVGVLFERVAPAGALTLHPPSGLNVGDTLPSMAPESLVGKPVRIGEGRGSYRALLLLFVSPDCPICRELAPAFRSFARQESAWVEVLFASDGGTLEDHRAYARSQGYDAEDYLLSRPLGLALQVPKVPYGVLLDQDGVIRARGLINNREHLESLAEALRRGVASVQEFVAETRLERPS